MQQMAVQGGFQALGMTEELWARIRQMYECAPPRTVGDFVALDTQALSQPLLFKPSVVDAVVSAVAARVGVVAARPRRTKRRNRSSAISVRVPACCSQCLQPELAG